MAVIALVSLLNFTQVAWAKVKRQAVEPDYTKGEKLGDGLNYQALGPTGAIADIWATGLVRGTDKTRMLQIREVLKGTPADGVLQKDDVILGVVSPHADGKPKTNARFDSNARRALSAALTEAEKKKNGGTLVLNVWRKGKTLPVTIKLQVMGAFSETAPWKCKKTEALIEAACKSILDRGLFIKEGRHQGRIRGGIQHWLEALGLLATGDKKYLPVIKKYARAIGKPDLKLSIEKSGMGSWTWSYTTVFLTEYYLATKDQYVLPAITEYATKIAMGRSGVGTWSHGMAIPSQNGGKLYGHASAYGAMNQCGITCAISLILAQKCGIKSREVDKAVELATQFLRWYVDKGTIPYGDHAPKVEHDNNGRNSQAAVMFDLIGDKEATAFFTRMTLASYQLREVGHTGHFFGWQWGAPGAARGGEEAAQSFIKNTRWFTEMERRADGGSVYQFQLAGKDHGKYRNWSTTGSRLLQYCLPRKQLYITGKGGSCISPITGKELKAIVAAAEFNPEKLSVKQLLEALGNWSPVVRHKAARALGDRDDNIVGELITMLNGKDRYARYGACEALCWAGRGSEEAVDALMPMLAEGKDITMRYFASLAFRQPKGRNKNRLAQGNAFRKVIPDLLKLAAMYDPQHDPGRKLHNELAETLFYGGRVSSHRGYFPGGKGIDKCDRVVLIPAIRSILNNPNGRARSLVSDVYDDLTEQDLKQLWGDIYYATKYQAPSGVMFSGGVRTNGMKLMAKHKIKEGIAVGVDYALRQEGWGNGGRKRGGIPPLLSYGKALKDYVEEINKVLAGWRGKETGSKNNPKDAEDFKKRLTEALSKPSPDLKSIKTYIEAYEKARRKRPE